MEIKVSPLAGKPVDISNLVNIPKLVTAYYTEVPDVSVPEQRVAFGTSGHRGSAFSALANAGTKARGCPSRETMVHRSLAACDKGEWLERWPKYVVR